MRVAEVLSDLTSLYLADPKAALALVTAQAPDSGSAQAETRPRYVDNDPDLTRAKDLVQLHARVKVAHQDGADRELDEAREAVARVLREM
ncbi:hypothetical protein LTR53_015131 [Teratosphaeriaceae sp. CCFEE 6253]|nr:hypothetical protein LTR53_015131 [Teratosphaeriaceae sp. CCFEE 6253]